MERIMALLSGGFFKGPLDLKRGSMVRILIEL